MACARPSSASLLSFLTVVGRGRCVFVQRALGRSADRRVVVRGLGSFHHPRFLARSACEQGAPAARRPCILSLYTS